MKKLEFLVQVLGMVGTNTYTCFHKESRECIIVDPADEASEIMKQISQNHLLPKAIFLTHGHFDHIQAVDELRKEYGIKVYASAKEKSLLEDPNANAIWDFVHQRKKVVADEYLKDGAKVFSLDCEWVMMATPGHTKGSCCYYCESEDILFSGDTLFRESYGRVDLPGGSQIEIEDSIRGKLFQLPERTLVLPGHGGATTIEYEKLHNPLAAN